MVKMKCCALLESHGNCMKRDLSHLPARHDAINLRLEDWATWVRVFPQAWKPSPIWRQYRSHAWQWERPEPKPALDTIKCAETERAVSKLPEKHRTAIRWAYIWYYVPVNAVRRELGVTQDGLAGLIDDGRDMLINRLKERMRE